MKRHIINITGFALMAIASAIGLTSNLLTLFNQDSLVGSVWLKWQIIIFVAAFAFTLGLSIYLMVVWILRMVNDRKINKE
jgi:hypothetical protein